MSAAASSSALHNNDSPTQSPQEMIDHLMDVMRKRQHGEARQVQYSSLQVPSESNLKRSRSRANTTSPAFTTQSNRGSMTSKYHMPQGGTDASMPTPQLQPSSSTKRKLDKQPPSTKQRKVAAPSSMDVDVGAEYAAAAHHTSHAVKPSNMVDLTDYKTDNASAVVDTKLQVEIKTICTKSGDATRFNRNVFLYAICDVAQQLTAFRTNAGASSLNDHALIVPSGITITLEPAYTLSTLSTKKDKIVLNSNDFQAVRHLNTRNRLKGTTQLHKALDDQYFTLFEGEISPTTPQYFHKVTLELNDAKLDEFVAAFLE